jgi:spore maturation protein CgeB
MKILIINSLYDEYLAYFSRKNKESEKLSYLAQKNLFIQDSFSNFGVWEQNLGKLGYEVEEIISNADSLQERWAEENNVQKINDNINLADIILAQINKFKPDIIWFNGNDYKLFELIRNKAEKVKLFIGWSGSAISKSDIWKHFDLVLTCAPEVMDKFNKTGKPTQLLPQGFDQNIIERVRKCTPLNKEIVFIGQIINSVDFHCYRETLLRELTKKKIPLEIYTASLKPHNLKNWGKYFVKYFIESIRAGKEYFKKEQNIIKNYSSEKLFRDSLKSAVYGLDMFNVLRSAKAALNIHADSSSNYASNMRLFEITGMGTCLLSDWRKNISQLFEVDREILTYKTPEECQEKIKWILANPAKARDIALNGQKRTLSEHSFEKRAELFDRILRNELKK